jgi:acyl dehydratase
MRYVYERDLVVLPTFAVVTNSLRATGIPKVAMPGIEVDLIKTLHGRQELIMHRPIPPTGEADTTSRVVDVYDKGSAAVIVTETTTPYFTSRISVFARGEGGFGGSRGPSTQVPAPDREPDLTILTKTWPQQALWYRLCGDLNPLHADPEFATRAGFPRPILHGLCTYGVVCKAVVDHALDGDPDRLVGYSGRFAGVVFPGETLRTRIWRADDRLIVTATVADRDDAPAFTDAVITTR